MRHLLLLLLAGAASWAALRHHRQQNHLHQQLAQLTAVLTTENDLANHNAQNTIKGIQAAIVKNRNQPADLALLRRAETLQACVNELVTTLRNYGQQLRHATGNTKAWQRLGASIGLKADQENLARQLLEQQLAAYVDTLHQLSSATAGAVELRTPLFDEIIPIAESLAELSQLESQVLAHQTLALQRISKAVGARYALAHLVITTTAASNVVAPGNIYRAKLGLVGYYSANELKMQMACNGRPVPADAAGVGQVRFRAPTRPGPASWTGTIRLNQNGRDTTFRVTVPYRVARR